MAPRERQKPFHFLYTSDGKQILISLFKCDAQMEKGFVRLVRKLAVTESLSAAEYKDAVAYHHHMYSLRGRSSVRNARYQA